LGFDRADRVQSPLHLGRRSSVGQRTIIAASGEPAKLTYDGRFSEDSEMHAGGAKVGLKF
jgi:hypothetical protein